MQFLRYRSNVYTYSIEHLFINVPCFKTILNCISISMSSGILFCNNNIIDITMLNNGSNKSFVIIIKIIRFS